MSMNYCPYTNSSPPLCVQYEKELSEIRLKFVIFKELLRKVANYEVTIVDRVFSLEPYIARSLKEIIKDMFPFESYGLKEEELPENVKEMIEKIKRENETVDTVIFKDKNTYYWWDVDYDYGGKYIFKRDTPKDIALALIIEWHRCLCGSFHFSTIAIVEKGNIEIRNVLDLECKSLLRKLLE